MNRECRGARAAWVWTCAIAAGLCASPASAAVSDSSATLEGRVYELAGADALRPVAFVNVIVLGVKRGTLSDEDGRFRIVALPAGEHRVKLMQAGFVPLDTVLSFAPRATTRLDAVLRVERLPPAEMMLFHAPKPAAPLRARLRSARVVRAYRLAASTDTPSDTATAIGGERIAEPLPRDAAWSRRLLAALGNAKTWASDGPGRVNRGRMYGLRLHDARGWVDLVVAPLDGWVFVSEDGGPVRQFAWNPNRGPLSDWFE